MAPDYDARDGQPTTEAQMSALKGSVEDSPWKCITLRVDPVAMNRNFKAHFTMDDVRFNNTTQDQKTIDPGQVFLAADTSSSLAVGKVWVNYECDLFTPQTPIITPQVGGANWNINSVAVDNTPANGPLRTPSTIVAAQNNANDPILDLSSFATNAGGLQRNVIGRFLRDFQGNVSLSAASPTTGFLQGANYYPSLYNALTGLITSLNVSAGVSPFGDNSGGAGLHSNWRELSYISALAGDYLLMPQFTGTGALGSTMSMNLNLGAGPNSFPFA